MPKKMLRFIVCIFTMCLVMPTTFAMPPTYVSDVVITGDAQREMSIGEEITLEAIATPEGIDSVYMRWSVDKENIINLQTTDSNVALTPPVSEAEITALAIGTVTITVYSSTNISVDEYDENASVTINVSASKSDAVETPVASPNGGNFTSSIDVTLSCATEGATIYYSLSSPDVSYPAEDIEYTKPITLDATTTITAYAVKDEMTDSERLNVTFTKGNIVETPTASPNGGNFTSSIDVTLSCATEGATIYYTTDGTPPTSNSTPYIGNSLTLSNTTTLKAIAVKDGMAGSGILEVKFTKQSSYLGGGSGGMRVSAPSANLKSGEIAKNSLFELATTYHGAKIYYTVDGSTPTKNSILYTEPIVIDKIMTVKYIVVSASGTSSVASQVFTVRDADISLKPDAEKIGYIKGYKDGTFRPDAAISRYEVLTCLNNLFEIEKTKPTITFADVESEYKDLVDLFVGAEIIDGYADNTFKGENGLTRSELVKIISSMLQLEDNDKSTNITYSDILGHWAEKIINVFTKYGYLNGYDDGTFKPDKTISRAEFISFMNRIIGVKVASEQQCLFSDLDKTHWAYNDIATASIVQNPK